MKVELLGHTQLAISLRDEILRTHDFLSPDFDEETKEVTYEGATCGQTIALAAIRQCYSHKTALEVLETESEKYFGDKGKEGKRLFNHIVKSGHTSTLEHIHFTFAVEGVSRALLAQLTRHRQLSFSVQSQRYNKFSSDSRSGGFDYVIPHSVKDEWVEKKIDGNTYCTTPMASYKEMMKTIQEFYDFLIGLGIPQEDARSVLPNAATCNLVTSGNLRAWLEFYKKRKKGEGAQHEITVFAELIRTEITNVEPWVSEYFDLS